ncbi:unnamed protein product [Pedinophyceae sp. YPF-701]|nr:unnamed protein product [Pedinophyceae sp. YPF-701]
MGRSDQKPGAAGVRDGAPSKLDGLELRDSNASPPRDAWDTESRLPLMEHSALSPRQEADVSGDVRRQLRVPLPSWASPMCVWLIMHTAFILLSGLVIGMHWADTRMARARPRSPRPWVVAHRGASGIYPEHTVEAYW